MTLAPWKSGRLLVWDVTCPDTFAISYRAHATLEAGKVAECAEDGKAEKYRGLPASHSFTPVAIETLGAIGPASWAFLKDRSGMQDSLGVGRTKVHGLPPAEAVSGCPERKLCLGAGRHEPLTLFSF